jgi:hypothetical protein
MAAWTKKAAVFFDSALRAFMRNTLPYSTGQRMRRLLDCRTSDSASVDSAQIMPNTLVINVSRGPPR